MTNFRQLALTILLTAALAACSTTSVVQEWHLDTPPGPQPDKIAVVVMLPDDLQRLSVERVLVEEIARAGGNAVPSSEIRGMRSSRLDREKAEKALRAADVDAVVVAFLKGAMRGEELQRADYYLQHEASGVYYDWYSPQFTEVYSIQEGAGFYEQERHIFVETTYYDLDTEQARWTMVTDSSALEYRDTAKAISGKIIAKMKRDGSL